MTTLSKFEIYQLCREKWGIPSQILMLAEEANELCKASIKMVRYGNYFQKSSIEFVNLAEEIADTEIMIDQTKYYFPQLKPMIEDFKKTKLAVLEDKIA
jgi:hypothetical protein